MYKKSRLVKISFFAKVGIVLSFLLFVSCFDFLSNRPSSDDDSNGTTTTAEAPIHAAVSVDFHDADLGEGEIAGILTIRKAASEEDVTGYVLYWGSSVGTKLSGSTAIAEFTAAGENFDYFFPPNSLFPNGATHFLVYTKNEKGEMSTATYCAISDAKGTVYTGTEGSIVAPVFLEAGMGGNSYAKQIGSGKSYYYSQHLGSFLWVTISGLTDDVDLIGYEDDSSFTSVAQKNSYGRKTSETVSASSASGNYYFIVDGGDTGYKLNAPGASFKITITSHSGAVGMIASVGSTEDPVELPEGETKSSMVGENGTSYYRVPVTQGESYRINIDSSVTAQIYTDQFTNPVTSQPVTATGNALYLAVSRSGSGTFFKVEIVRSEGTETLPVYLITGKGTYGQVGGTSSYYSFDVTPGHSYTVSIEEFSSSFSHDLDLYVFQGSGFSGVPAASSATAADPETCNLTASSGTISVRVDDKSGSGGAFLLKVE